MPGFLLPFPGAVAGPAPKGQVGPGAGGLNGMSWSGGLWIL